MYLDKSKKSRYRKYSHFPRSIEDSQYNDDLETRKKYDDYIAKEIFGQMRLILPLLDAWRQSEEKPKTRGIKIYTFTWDDMTYYLIQSYLHC